MPARRSSPLLRARALLACAFLPSGTLAAGQVSAGLDSAPEPRLPSAAQPGSQSDAQLAYQPLPASRAESSGDADAGTTGAADRQPETAPVLSMAPHSENARYWVSGQANSIFQMHGHFHSPYQ